ncbi:MAG: glycoside hydrolase N-terminal domain-containing protein [Akkermansiaceae bacterium]|nr:glycoside hydrolase N-terminal domain-containing protein [Akkermansiaceae bacterium]
MKAIVSASVLLLSSIAHAVESSAERAQDVLGPDSLTLPAPVKRWDNGLPLGNGLTGGLLWGEGRELRLSLDRGDLWDERGNANANDPQRTYQTMLESIAAKDRATWDKLFNATYTGSKWTKIPGGRLVMTLPEGREIHSFHLDFATATASVKLAGDKAANAFFSATEPLALLRVPKGTGFEFIRPKSIDQLGYPEPVIERTENEIAYSQTTAEGLEFCFLVHWQDVGGELHVAITTRTNRETKNPQIRAHTAAVEAVRSGWDQLHATHAEWWSGFYQVSDVDLPLPRLQHHYNLVKYLYGSGSRRGAPPMPLQGVWTADEGKLPPWKGDYHNDLNTQMTYVAWQAAGLTDPGMSYIDYYVDRMPRFRKFGKEFFGTDGAMIPGVMTLDGQAMGGWPQYAFSLTAGIWNGHAFYQHWKTTMDERFLRQTAYPWLAEITSSVLRLCDERDGKLHLKTSSSPEWNDNRWEAYLTPNSTFDQALLTWAVGALEEMARTLGKNDDAAKWDALAKKMTPLRFDDKTKALLVGEGIAFEHSHRHFSHAMAIHPLGILHIDQGDAQREAVRATVRQIIDNGSRAWVGYSFTWAASLAARAGFPDDAARLLTDFERAFVTRNGFHVNGDQTKSGLSGFTYRPFTLEGNFLFMDAVHEMLLQSWGGRLRVFPAVPDSWADASFSKLRAEGGFVVSATRKHGKTTSVTISSEHGGTFRLADPFAGGVDIVRELAPGGSATLEP